MSINHCGPVAHNFEAEAGRLYRVRRQSDAVVRDLDPYRVGPHIESDIDGPRPCVFERIRQTLLSNTEHRVRGRPL